MNRELVEIKLSVDQNNKIHFEFVDEDLEEFFNAEDARTFFPGGTTNPDFPGVRSMELAAAASTRGRKERRAHGGSGKVPKGQLVSADDYNGELVTIHAGIHLRFNGKDQICWFSDQEINFVIDVGPDPELFLLQDDDLLDSRDLTMADLTCEQEFINSGGRRSGNNNPFANLFPQISRNGSKVFSGPLLDEPRIRRQRLYKYTISVLGTPIVLDPHIEGHDD